MIKFIKKLLGLGSAEPAKVVTPVVETKPTWTSVEVKVEPARSVVSDNFVKPNKVRAITDTKPGAVKAATAPKPANKKRRPYRGNKVKAGGAVAKVNQPKLAVTEGSTKTNVKPAQVAKAKPVAPKAPVAKKK